jgi:site-specific recombinase XerD
MTTALIPQDEEARAPLAAVLAQAQDYVRHAKAAATWRAYQSDWRDFERWCLAHTLAPMPAAPQTVALYLSDLAQRCKVSTLQRRLAAISQVHQAVGVVSPSSAGPVRLVMAGIRRAKGTAQTAKAPVVTATLQAMLRTLPDRLIGQRDRALLLVGFAGALRRSELVGLDVGDITFPREGMVITLRRSKNDQEGQGRTIGIPLGANPDTCPVRAVEAWLQAARITSGPVFRAITRHGQLRPGRLSDKAVALIVKRAAQAAGLDPRAYAGHSLRAGLATAAAAAGVSERAIMNQTGHKSVAVARRYIRAGSLFRENAAAAVGL